MKRYLTITPVRDEERFLPGLIESMRAQTVAPQLWIIIDDGSIDRSSEIIETAAKDCGWIQPRYLSRNGARKPGGESVIMRFLPRELWNQFDFIVRFDADLKFEPEYISALLEEFERDPKLGIASGSLYEPHGGGWREKVTPRYHTRGPSKVYSRACFEAIGGLTDGLGWDTVDGARAMMLGFRTRSFRHIRAYHLRAPGGARGALRGRLDAGRAAFVAGYSPLFMLLRSFKHVFSPPLLAGGLWMLAGFTIAAMRGEVRHSDRELIRFIRFQQRQRILLRESLWR
jgi:biofilm PGA synthesis N-glycosyltransferase PgaC